MLSSYFGNIAFAYEDYGYPYCLATTFFNTGIGQPNGYSEELMDEIIRSEGEIKETDTEQKTNIIFLQLESFFDPTLVNFLEVSEDPMPNFRKLMEEYSSGYYRVPSVGAGTANTEFESITGMSMHYFGPGEYPYKSILQEETCESVPYVLRSWDIPPMRFIIMRRISIPERQFSPDWDLTPSPRKSICRISVTRQLRAG